MNDNFNKRLIIESPAEQLETRLKEAEEKEKRAAELIIANKELAFQNEEKDKRAAELIIANEELAFQSEEKDKRAAELIIANRELAFQSEEKEKRAAELIIANKELAFQSEEKEKRAEELIIANKELAFQSEEKDKRAAELAFQNDEKEKRAAELAIANKELAFQNEEKDKRAAELVIANKELAFQNEEKEKRAAELVIANKELAFQNEEKEKRAAELVVANKELAFQNEEKEKRAAELAIANKELAFQNEEKDKRAAELVIANKELAFQNEEKDKRAAELVIANKELAFQNEEKDKRAAELVVADKELAYQSEEKNKRAAELVVADKELAYQSEEKDKPAAELVVADKELAYQSEEKDKRAAELVVADKELAYQSEEKEKRAAELVVADKELAYQSEEKEKRAAELIIANKELAFQNKEKGKWAMQTHELKEQNIELELQKKQLDEASQLKSAFLSNMSHELRTPLNAIVGYSELALKTDLSTQQRNYLSKIKISSHTLLGLISDILDLSKIEAGKFELEIATFNLAELLQNAVSQVSVKMYGKGLKLTVSIDKDVPINLSGDSQRLGQIILNLASNAVKFTEKGEIVIRAELLENDGISAMIQFSVKDTGIGLTEEQIMRLFQPFTQADVSTTRKYGGTGLGLSISQDLVKMMNGDIWVESELGAGSIFFFTIKINVADNAADIAADIVADKERFRQYKNSLGSRGIKVLVVDDKEDSREIIESMLADMYFNVTMSASGEEAIAILEKTKENHSYDLIIMDWKMPGMDGIEASKRIKSLYALGKAPSIILLTAYRDEGVQEKAEQIGLLEAVLYKPITPSLLFNAIIHVCGKESLKQISTDAEGKNDTAYLPQLYGIRVLLVEDNEINWEVAKEILQEAGLTVTIVNNGRQAIDEVKTNTYDIVLMDIQMPIMDGYDATREIRKDPIFAELPIIAMTANALLSDQEKCLLAGMNDYVAKPIDTTQLFQKIAYWTKKTQGIPGETAPDVTAPDVTAPDSSTDETFAMNIETMPNLVGIDVQTGLGRLGGNQRLYFKLLVKFHENHKHTIKEIRYALDNGDFKAAELLAHTIKGAAGNIGAQDVYLNAGALEAEFRVNTLNDVKLFLEQLEQALEQTLASISLSIMMKNMEAMQNTRPVGADIVLLKPILDKLGKLLHDNDMDAVECVEEIVRQTKNTSFSKKAAEMKDYVDQYDFEGALSIFNETLNGIGEVSDDGKRQQ